MAVILLLGCTASRGGPSPGLLRGTCRARPVLRPSWSPGPGGQGIAHSLEQAHAHCGSQVEGRARVSLLGHIPKRLVQAFHKTLPSPRRVVSVARDAPT